MSDLRLISISSSGEVTLTPELMHIPLTPREEAIQRLVICLMNTPGTMIDAPGWGGGAKKLYLATRKASFADTKKQVEEVIHRTQVSLSRTEPINSDYRIINLNIEDVVRKERGYNVILRVDFANAASENFSIPGKVNVIS